ncbi:MAG: hypothetical protein HY617_02875 [Candidatus Sungbacteria bacterium]|nr:hypothetical protein [Candidatus Sungbacteria bacterium]
MKKLRLRRNVGISGKDIFGRQAHLTFSPIEKPGWWWQYHQDKEPLLITPDLLRAAWRRMRLVHIEPRNGKPYILECCEHILSLRWLGLDGIVLHSEENWPPYFGSPFGYWRKLYNRCIDGTEDFSWVTPRSPVTGVYYRESERWTRITPQDTPLLSARIIINYPGLGQYAFDWHTDTFDPSWLSAPTQGWPAWLRYPLSMLPKSVWPHCNQIIWPGKQMPAETLHFFALHRLGDLLGAWAFADPTSLVAARVVSHQSVHWADIAAIQRLKDDLIPVDPSKNFMTPE